jgi:hypothetical protein
MWLVGKVSCLVWNWQMLSNFDNCDDSTSKKIQSPLEPQEQKPYSSILTLQTAHFSP